MILEKELKKSSHLIYLSKENSGIVKDPMSSSSPPISLVNLTNTCCLSSSTSSRCIQDFEDDEMDTTEDLTYLSPTNSEIYLSNMGKKIIESSKPLRLNPKRFVMVDENHGYLRGGQAENEELMARYVINQDPKPIVINKKLDMMIDYAQEIAVRYLRPPTPPPPGDIIIQEMPSRASPQAPPVIIRQLPRKCPTPEPLVLREKPPAPPKVDTKRRLIRVPGKRLPPPPRRVIFERMAPIPPKPQSILIERWLPYSRLKRRVILLKSKKPKTKEEEKPHNVIIQWDSPQVNITREFKYLGVIRANPSEYESRYKDKLVSNLPHFVSEIKLPNEKWLENSDGSCSDGEDEELVGDVEALAMIDDLDLVGLAKYRSYLTRKGIINNKENSNNRREKDIADVFLNEKELLEAIETVFQNTSRKNSKKNERISYSDAARILRRLDFARNGRPVENLDLNMLFAIVDKDKRGSLGLDEFRKAFLNLSALYA